MAKPKLTEKQCRACKAVIDYSATRCRYCTAQQSSAEAMQQVGKSLMMLGCALPVLVVAVLVVLALAAGGAKP